MIVIEVLILLGALTVAGGLSWLVIALSQKEGTGWPILTTLIGLALLIVGLGLWTLWAFAALDEALAGGPIGVGTEVPTLTVPTAVTLSAVHFCELEWDFSEFLDVMGRENVSFDTWKVHYRQTAGLDVMASGSVTQAAEKLFDGLRNQNFRLVRDGSVAARVACQAEGFLRPSG